MSTLQIKIVTVVEEVFEIESKKMSNFVYLDVQVGHIVHALRLSIGGVMEVVGAHEGKKRTLLISATALRSLIQEWAKDPLAGFYGWDGCELSIRAEIQPPKPSESHAQTAVSKGRGPSKSAVKEVAVKKETKGLLRQIREAGPWVDEGLLQAIKLCQDTSSHPSPSALKLDCDKILLDKFLLKTHVQCLGVLVKVSLYHSPKL